MTERPETGRAAMGDTTGGVPGNIPAPRAALTTWPAVRVPRQDDAADRSARELPLEAPVSPLGIPHQIRDERRGEVVLRHARLTGRGRPTFCSPTRAEQAGTVSISSGRGTDGKVIYPTREAAEAAARELQELGARRLRPYLCARSRHGHFHLATDTAQRLPGRIPQQRRSA